MGQHISLDSWLRKWRSGGTTCCRFQPVATFTKDS